MPVGTKPKILVIRGGAIGDFILTMPVLSALRDQFQDAELTLLGYPHIASLAKASGLAQQLRSIEAQALAGFFADRGALNPELSEFFAGFGLIVSYLYDPDKIFQANVGRCTRAQFIAGPHRPAEGGLHATEVFLKPLERLAIFDPDPMPVLEIRSEFRLPPGPGLALHPGSGSHKKNWPSDQWQGLIERLVDETNFNFLVIGGEAEEQRAAQLAEQIPCSRRLLAQNLPLVQLAERLVQADYFIGHDSGITHLAAALGLPGLVLWGDSDPNVWRPRSERIELLHPERTLIELPVDAVAEALLPRLAAVES